MSGRTFNAIVIAATALLLAACAGPPVNAPVGNLSTQWVTAHHAPQFGYYTVRREDTLYSIAWEYGYDYHDLAAWNGIAPPYTIYVGERLRLRPSARAQRRHSRTSYRAKPAVVPLHWQWPVHGPIIQGYDPDSIGKKGITLGGRLGQPVHAAAAGRVVYSGSGLVAYGRLIIIQHSNDYLSAYAHNSKLLVKEGERVRRGQVIALMGSSGTDRVELHFEIRRDGRPVNPLRYLPKR